MGPCLGALLCREEATSDNACSTLEAAIDVAWTEPVEAIKRIYQHRNNEGHIRCIKDLIATLSIRGCIPNSIFNLHLPSWRIF